MKTAGLCYGPGPTMLTLGAGLIRGWWQRPVLTSNVTGGLGRIESQVI